ncbi:hypothetical protein D3C87_1760710 [compost metagenome]
MPDELFPVVTMVPRLIRVLFNTSEVVTLKLFIPEASPPTVVIVAPLSLMNVPPLPLVNRPSE